MNTTTPHRAIPVLETPAPLAAHARALRLHARASARLHCDDADAFSYAADLLERENVTLLRGSLACLETAPRDVILDHVHPGHWKALGYKPADATLSLALYAVRFGQVPAWRAIDVALVKLIRKAHGRDLDVLDLLELAEAATDDGETAAVGGLSPEHRTLALCQDLADAGVPPLPFVDRRAA